LVIAGQRSPPGHNHLRTNLRKVIRKFSWLLDGEEFSYFVWYTIP
jgi:hypothetical protein